MSTSTIFKEEIDFFSKKGKWKKCICEIQFILRIKSTVCALIREVESLAVIEIIDIYGYKCGVNTIEFVFIGRKSCYFIRFKDINRMIELEKILKKHVNDVNYFVQLDDFKKSDCTLILKEWYRFHVQINRICLTADKSHGLIKIWNIHSIGQMSLNECYLTIEIISSKDSGFYTFHHDSSIVLEKIHNALIERKLELPSIKSEGNYLIKRKSEATDLKRFNSYSNSSEIKKIHRIRTLSSTETNEYDYDTSLPSTPAYTSPFDATLSSRNNDSINGYAEPSLVFQMDALDCGSLDSSGIYNGICRSKTNSEADDTISTESFNKSYRKVGLEKFPFEADSKKQTNISPSSPTKESSSEPLNKGIISRPKNGRCYQSIQSLKRDHKTFSDVNLTLNSNHSSSEIRYSEGNEKKENSQEDLTMDSDDKCSSSSFLHTPSPMSNISNENQSIPIPTYGNSYNSNYVSSIYKENHFSLPNHEYYNLSSHIIATPLHQRSNNNHQYLNLMKTLQSDPVDIKPTANECRKLNYLKLDLPNYDKNFHRANQISDTNYKEIDIEKTEILKSLDEYSLSKPHKKGFFKSFKK